MCFRGYLALPSVEDLHPAYELLAAEGELAVIGNCAHACAALEGALGQEGMTPRLPLRNPRQHLQWTPDVHRLLTAVCMRVEANSH